LGTPPTDEAPVTPATLALSAQTTIPQSQLPIGKIQVNHHWYEILEVLFLSHGLVGRGTVCYLVRKDEEEYIVKDHWVVGRGEDVIMNEIVMLKKMQGVQGVLELVDYCKVVLSSGEVDCTSVYCSGNDSPFKNDYDLRTHICIVMKLRGWPLHHF